jgi:hypothetical protein
MTFAKPITANHFNVSQINLVDNGISHRGPLIVDFGAWLDRGVLIRNEGLGISYFDRNL